MWDNHRKDQEAGSSTHAKKPAITKVTSTVRVVPIWQVYCKVSHAGLPWDPSSLYSAAAHNAQLLQSARRSTRLLLQEQMVQSTYSEWQKGTENVRAAARMQPRKSGPQCRIAASACMQGAADALAAMTPAAMRTPWMNRTKRNLGRW